jgi:hypothetical protein
MRVLKKTPSNGVHHSMGVKRQRRDEDEPTNFVCYGMVRPDFFINLHAYQKFVKAKSF